MRRVLVFLVLASIASTARAQHVGEPEAEPARTSQRGAWSASFAQSVDVPSSSAAPWLVSRLGVQRRYASGAVMVEGGRVERYGRSAAFGAVEVYHTLWRGSYGYGRLLLAPQAVTSAQSDGAVEVFQSVPGGWEVSAGGRRLAFASEGAWLATASAATYLGPWIARARVVTTVGRGAPVVSPSVSVRGLADPASPLVPRLEVAAGQGREVLASPQGERVGLRRSWFGMIRGEWRLTPAVGVNLGITYARDAGAARPGGEVGVTARW